MVNKVTLIGNLGRDPEGEEGKFCRLNIATSRKWTSKNGEKQEETEWHRVVVFGKTGDACLRYLKKGRSVFVEGRIKTEKYEKDGQTRYTTNVIANDVKFLGGKDSPSHAPGSIARNFSPDDYTVTNEEIPF